MSQPHHHVFNAIQRQINRGVPIKEVLPLLLEKGVIKPDMVGMIEKGGMKIVTGYLRNRDFDTFLTFVECVCKACCDPKSSRKVMSQTLDSIQEVVRDFDTRYKTEHCSRVTAIVDRYIKPATMLEEASEMEEEERQLVRVAKGVQELTVTGEEEQEIAEEEQQVQEEEPEPAGATAAIPSSVIVESDHNLSLPDLPYVTEPVKVPPFTSEAGHYYNNDWEFSIDVPAGAVPDGQEITVRVGACCYGPFIIHERYLVATGFFCMTASEDFQKEITITLEHCLLLPCYQQDSRVIVLKADHHIVTNNGDFTFKYYANPDLSTTEPKLSFKAKDFCIFCGVLEKEADPPQFSERTQECSSTASDTTSTQTSSAEPISEKTIQHLTVDTATDLQLAGSRGLKRPHPSESQSAEKRKRRLEYTILAYEPPSSEKVGQFQVWAFVCHNCSVAIKECQKQAEKQKLVSTSPLYYENFNFGCNNVITFSLQEKHTPGWQVTLKGTGSVLEDDINIYTQPLSQQQQCDLRERTEMFIYPPRKVFEVAWETYLPPERGLSVEARIHGTSRFYSEEYLHFAITANAGLQNPVSQLSLLSAGFTGSTFVHSPLNQQSIRVHANRLSNQQKNQPAETNHLARAARGVQHFDNLCAVLELRQSVIQAIVCNHRHMGLQEWAMQALLEWMKGREVTTVGNVVTVLSEASELSAIQNLVDYCCNSE